MGMLNKARCAFAAPVWVGLLVAVAGCAAPPAVPTASTPPSASADALAALYAALPRTGGQLYRLDPATSVVRIYAFRSGALAHQFGHNHVLSAPDFSGYVWVAAPEQKASRFDLVFRLDALELDNPALRRSLGPAFASTIGPELVASTREHMLGSTGLQAEQFPLVRIASLQVLGEAPKLSALVSVELHGQQRSMWLPLSVQLSAQALQVQGALVLRQSEFGVTPYSLLNGLLAVEDPVVVEFNLQAVAIYP